MAISLGTATITAIYLGTTAITTAYLGTTQVFGGGGDAYAVGGESPELVTDFVADYYRKAGTDSTFAGVLTHSLTSMRTMVDSTGAVKWAPHNMFAHSEAFNSWSKTNTPTLVQGGVDPNGLSNSAVTLIDNSAGGTGEVYVLQIMTVVTGADYVFSFYAKADQLSKVTFRGAGVAISPTAVITYDLSSGTITYTSSGSPSIQSIGSGWYRCSFPFNAASTSANLRIYVAEADNNLSVARDGTSSILIWGASLCRVDIGGMVDNPDTGNSYVPTSGGAVYMPARGHHIHNGTTWVNRGLLLETVARTNMLLNSGTLSTQSVTTTAVAHTLHFSGTGTVTLTGTSTAGPLVGSGTGEQNRVSLTFTPTAGTLTLTVSGTVTNAQLEIGATPSSYIPTAGATVTRAAETLSSAAANHTPSTTAISMQMDGRLTYADLGTAAQQTFVRWHADTNNYILLDLDTDGAATGEVNAEQRASGTIDGVAFGTNYSPGVNVAFNIASRHTSGAINVAKDGTAGTADTTPTALANLDSTNLQLGHAFMGTIGKFRLWEDVDLGDSGIATAST
jgi:hypothetical protein